MHASSEFFQTSGTLSENAPSYIKRPADDDLLAALRSGELCLVLAPRQSGKSSLMVQTNLRLKAHGIYSKMIDLQSLGSQENPERWFGAVAHKIRRSFGLHTNSREWWKTHHDLVATERFMNFLEDVVLAEIQEHVVICFDEVDSVLSLPFSDDFFTTIRSLYNQRASNATLKRLTFVLLGVATASSFIRDRSRTPFNIGSSIALDDFSQHDLTPFRKVLGADNEPLIQRIFYWTDGHPNLVQRLSAEASSWEPQERTAEHIDQEVSRLYFESDLEKDSTLKNIQDYLLADVSVFKEVFTTYQQILEQDSLPYHEQSLVHNRLKLSGIVKIQDNQMVPRNNIYKTRFDEQWVQQYIELSSEELAFLSDARSAAFVPGYAYDIFVSYDHIDNEPWTTEDDGWVTTLVKGIERNLAQRLGSDPPCRIYCNAELAKHVQITPDIRKVLYSAAVFIIILSRAYLKSEWCNWRKNRFLSMIQERLRSDFQVFVLELDRLEENEQAKLLELSDARRHRFWEAAHERGRARLLGKPRPSPEHVRYYERLEELSEDILQELQRLRERAILHEQENFPFESSEIGPYPGFRHFKTSEHHLFFGREPLIHQIVESLTTTRVVSLIGPCGCGKTSVVQAGLVPFLTSRQVAANETPWQVITVNPGKTPLKNLVEAFIDTLPPEQTSSMEAGAMLNALQHDAAIFREFLHQLSPSENSRILLIIDQFEEIFRYETPENQTEIQIFIKLLLESLKQEKSLLHLVITLRTEFLDACLRFQGLPEALNQEQILIPALTDDQLRMAIAEPAKVFGVEVEAKVSDRILENMHKDPSQLPIFQHCLRQIWQQVQSKRRSTYIEEGSNRTERVRLTLQDYEAAGGLEQALAIQAEDVFHRLNSNQQYIAAWLFRRLSEPEAANTSVQTMPGTVREVASLLQFPESKVMEVVEIFRHQEYNFLSPDTDLPLEPDSLLRINYEKFLRRWPRLQEWIEQELHAAEIYRYLERTAGLWKQGKAEVLSSLDFKNVKFWWNQEHPNARWAARYGRNFSVVSEFLAASEDKIKQQQERERLKNQRIDYELHQKETELRKKETELRKLQEDYTQEREAWQKSKHQAEQIREQQELDVRKLKRKNRYARIRERILAGLLAVLVVLALWSFSQVSATKDALSTTRNRLNSSQESLERVTQERDNALEDLRQLEVNPSASASEPRLENIALLDEHGTRLAPDENDVYRIKVGQTIILKAEYSVPSAHDVEFVWETLDGSLYSHTPENLMLYTAGQPGPASILVTMTDMQTGDRVEGSIFINKE